jgi:hypothetical protein
MKVVEIGYLSEYCENKNCWLMFKYLRDVTEIKDLKEREYKLIERLERDFKEIDEEIKKFYIWLWCTEAGKLYEELAYKKESEVI